NRLDQPIPPGFGGLAKYRLVRAVARNALNNECPAIGDRRVSHVTSRNGPGGTEKHDPSEPHRDLAMSSACGFQGFCHSSFLASIRFIVDQPIGSVKQPLVVGCYRFSSFMRFQRLLEFSLPACDDDPGHARWEDLEMRVQIEAVVSRQASWRRELR